MRTLLVAVVAGLLTVWAAAPARADLLSVSGDIPVTYSFTESALKDPSVSGIKVGVSLPIFVGFGAESYKVTGKFDDTITPVTDFEYQVTMYDLFVDLPFPVANLVLGGGVGQGDFEFPAVPGTTQTADLSQLFFSIGIPFAAVFDAHVGYHKISGDVDNVVTGLGNTVNVDAEMATIGLKVGF